MRGEHYRGVKESIVTAGSPPHARGAPRVRPHSGQPARITPACAGSTADHSVAERLGGDHPRMRGEHACVSLDDPSIMGSPPHARGARVDGCPRYRRHRITPACAGSTFAGPLRRGARWDHPRMRGEHVAIHASMVAVRGSPPHARGALDSGCQRVGNVGITPACAGSTAPPGHVCDPGQDHPRMRGEHSQVACSCQVAPGSPPHARGARSWSLSFLRSGRITPACAGSTVPPPTAASRSRDHPRMRGEHASVKADKRRRGGSPPHARGAHQPSPVQSGRQRITPACAGSTSSGLPTRAVKGDHPRMRGEHGVGMVGPDEHSGSPPHARGAPPLICHRLSRGGITPACAGSTCSTRSTLSPSPDHPRMRGEHTSHLHYYLLQPGSPPHARGAHVESPDELDPQRITPACAGSTHLARRTEMTTTDHPRMRGEHGMPLGVGDDETGSPPHARGARGASGTVRRLRRITPACAGSTDGVGGAVDGGEDHPRMRGEHSASVTADTVIWGSPPHARGARPAHRPSDATPGITPACAGSTASEGESTT